MMDDYNKLIFIFLKEIKSKSQISEIDDKLILNLLNDYFQKFGNVKKKILIEFNNKDEKIVKSKLFKLVLKEIRSQLGQIYGQFLTSNYSNKFEKLLNNFNSLNNKNIYEFLKLHKSSRERLNYYDEIYNFIFNDYFGNFQNKIGILDIASGFNPISVYFLIKNKKLNIIKYISIDLNKKDSVLLNNFFKKYGFFNYKAFSYNVLDLIWLKELNFKDITHVFLFKALDSFEELQRNFSKKLILQLINNLLDLKYIVVSFPTKSIKSKIEFNRNKRNWFFKFLEKIDKEYDIFEVENEMFIKIKIKN
jgi:hypothetical protein